LPRRANATMATSTHGTPDMPHAASALPETSPRSLTRFLIEEQRAGHLNPELRLLLAERA